jgi:hypothetical protein
VLGRSTHFSSFCRSGKALQVGICRGSLSLASQNRTQHIGALQNQVSSESMNEATPRTLLPIETTCIPRYSKHIILSNQQSLREPIGQLRLDSNKVCMQRSSNALRPRGNGQARHLAQPKKIDTQCRSIRKSAASDSPGLTFFAIQHADIRFGLLLLPELGYQS